MTACPIPPPRPVTEVTDKMKRAGLCAVTIDTFEPRLTLQDREGAVASIIRAGLDAQAVATEEEIELVRQAGESYVGSYGVQGLPDRKQTTEWHEGKKLLALADRLEGFPQPEDPLATMFATMASDLAQLLERRLKQLMEPRLEKMKGEILRAIRGDHGKD